MAETYYTIRQVAERTSVHYQTIWKMVKQGDLEAIRIASSWRIPESAVEKLTRKGR